MGSLLRTRDARWISARAGTVLANTYRPYFWVALIPSEDGTVLSVKCFGYGVIGGVIALVFVILVFGVTHGEWTFVLYFVLGLVVMHVLCWFRYETEKNHVVRWLSALIRG